MISLETRDAWTFNLAVTVGGSTNTFANTATSAVAAIVALVAWANDGARAWTGTRTFTWSWARDDATGGAKLTLSATGTFTIDGAAYATLGLDAAGPTTTTTGRTVALGTWAPKGHVGVTRYLRFMDEQGDASATGAIRPGLPSKAAYRPTIEAIGNAQDAARMAYVLGKASNPRRGWFHRSDTATWIYLAVGPVESNRNDGTMYGFNFECRGG